MHRLRASVLALIFGFVALAASSARADAVMGPPADCPPGAVGDTSHNGPWCRPTTCTSDADCVGVGRPFNDQAPTRVCREQPLCVETRSEKSKSGWSHGTPFERTFAHGVCADAAACTAPATCETAKRCVVATVPTDTPAPAPAPAPVATPAPAPAPATGEAPPATDGSRCRVTSGGRAVDALWLLALLGLARRRRGGASRA